MSSQSDEQTNAPEAPQQDAPENTNTTESSAKPKAKVLESNAKDFNNGYVNTMVCVYEPRTKGKDENTWQVYPVLVRQRDQKEGAFYELNVVQANMELTPKDAMILAEGGQRLRASRLELDAPLYPLAWPG